MSLIQFHHVSKEFDRNTALEEVTFQLAEGSFHFLYGPSGAGKTTLMRLVYRDLEPSRGQVLLDGQNIGKLSAGEIPYLRRRIGVVFQDFHLMMDRTVFENVAIALLVQGKSKREINPRVMDVLSQLGLSDKRSSPPRTLSAGEQQRLSFARALVKDPDILLADEPTGNLDPNLSRDILDLMEQINRRGTTLLVATHDRMTAEHYDHPALRLEEGRLVDQPDRTLVRRAEES